MNASISRFQADDFQGAAEVLDRFGERSDLDHLRTFLASDRNFFVVASVADAWVGFAYGYELSRPDGSSMLFLYSIDVLPKYRRHGVATALVSFMRRAAESKGMNELFVFTTRSNTAAVGLYKATGGMAQNGDDLLFVYHTHVIGQLA